MYNKQYSKEVGREIPNTNNMLQNKDIKNLSEFKSIFVDSHYNLFFFTQIIDLLKMGNSYAVPASHFVCLFSLITEHQ